MKRSFLFVFFILHSSFFILNAQPLGQYPVNVMTIDELPQNVHAKLRVSANVGGVYRFARMQSSSNQQENDFFNRLRWGASFNADLTYFFSENYGLGAVYSYARHSHKINDYRYQPVLDFPDRWENGTLDDKIEIQFIGPAFQYRYYTNYREDAFRAHIGMGYVDYRDNSLRPHIRKTDPQTSIIYTSGGREKAVSGAFGILVGIGYDFAFSETWALGVQLSGLIATRNRERRTMENGEVEDIDLAGRNAVDNLARVELTVGLRFNK